MPDLSPVSPEVAYRALRANRDWVVERERLYRDYRLPSFVAAVAMVNSIAEVAEAQGHHPNICIHEWCFVHVELYTHIAGGLSRADIELAKAIDAALEPA